MFKSNEFSSLFQEVFGDTKPASPASASAAEAMDLSVALDAVAFYQQNGNVRAQDQLNLTIQLLNLVIQKLTASLCERHGV